MRFAIFVAFLLPFAGAVAALPNPVDSWAAFSQAYVLTNIALQSTIDQLHGGRISQLPSDQEQQYLAGKFQEADDVLGSAHQATLNIFYAYEANTAPSENEYVDGLCAYTMVKNELTRSF